LTLQVQIDFKNSFYNMEIHRWMIYIKKDKVFSYADPNCKENQ